jgi:endonuclease G
MQIDTQVIFETTARLERRHGSRLRLPPERPTPTAVLPPDRLARVANYINANRAPDDVAALERAMGTNDSLSLFYFWAGLRAARAVGCIKIAPGPSDPEGMATGFLIAPNLPLTNWHVFKTEDPVRRAGHLGSARARLQRRRNNPLLLRP